MYFYFGVLFTVLTYIYTPFVRFFAPNRTYVWFRLDEFIEWIESKGYTFLGGVREMIDGKFPDPYDGDDDCEDEEDQDDG
jgi:hypothetical protein